MCFVSSEIRCDIQAISRILWFFFVRLAEWRDGCLVKRLKFRNNLLKCTANNMCEPIGKQSLFSFFALAVIGAVIYSASHIVYIRIIWSALIILSFEYFQNTQTKFSLQKHEPHKINDQTNNEMCNYSGKMRSNYMFYDACNPTHTSKMPKCFNIEFIVCLYNECWDWDCFFFFVAS